MLWPGRTARGSSAWPGRCAQTWNTPLALDAALEQLLAGATSDELRGMLAAVGVKPPGTKLQRLAALVEHHSDRERLVAVVATAPGDGPEAARTPSRSHAEPIAVHPVRPCRPRPRTRRPVGARDRGLLIQDRDRYSPARFP